MKFDFDKVVCRKDSNCAKWDILGKAFGNENAIALWVADMDFEVDPSIREAIEKRLSHEVFGYTFTPDSYYDAVISWMKKRHDWDVKKEWIKFTPGVVPGINYIIGAFTKPGDEVIVQTPVYHQFFQVIKNNGCEIVDSPLINEEGKYTIDFKDFEDKITDKTKMFLLCSPHNPIGRVWSQEELRKLAEICLRHNILIVSDEIHSDLVFSKHKHLVISTLSKDIEDISIICTAPNKTFNIAGLHTANIMIPNEELRNKFSEHLQKLCISGPTIFGAIAQEAAYSKGEEWYEDLMEYLRGNIDFAVDFIQKRIPKLKVQYPEGTYLLWVDFSDLGFEGEELYEKLISEAGVVLNKGGIFGEGYECFQRINVGTRRAIVEEALEKIEKFVNGL
ncbi:MAG: MalY/PatB family protein [Clostridium sp.]